MSIKTLPASWYFDPKVFELERKAIFGCQWLYAASQEDLKGVGDFVTLELAGFPILLLVDSDGILRAFHNVCRHRAAPLLTSNKGKLEHKTLTCSYHSWVYDLSGNLLRAPRCNRQDLEKTGPLSLFELKVGTMHDLVFVNFNRNAPALKESFRQLDEEMQRTAFSLADYTLSVHFSREGNFNWKVWVDGYQECYHCTSIHPLLHSDFALSSYQVENHQRFSVHSCDRRRASSMGGHEGLWLWIYPNLGLPCYETCFYTLQANPLSPTKTQLNYHLRFKSSEKESARHAFVRSVEQITQEDIKICEDVQKNLGAGAFSDGYLSPDREGGVIYFHSLIRGDLTNPAYV